MTNFLLLCLTESPEKQQQRYEPGDLAGTSQNYGDEVRGDIIMFYNTVYVKKMQAFAMKFADTASQVRSLLVLKAFETDTRTTFVYFTGEFVTVPIAPQSEPDHVTEEGVRASSNLHSAVRQELVEESRQEQLHHIRVPEKSNQG